MIVTFDFAGLNLLAECDFRPADPGRLSGPPERCYPPTSGAAEITALTCNGTDASFLLNSDFAGDLNDAAYDACVEQQERCREDALEALAERTARWEDAA